MTFHLTNRSAGRRIAAAVAAASVAALVATLVAGCASGIEGRYAPPAVVVPSNFPSVSLTGSTRIAANDVVTAPVTESATAAPNNLDHWWTAFDDPALNRVVDAALAANNNLAAATIRVRRAQLQAGLADAALRPVFGGSVNANASRSLDNGGPALRTSNFNIGASYEVDLWNRLGSQRDAARWEAAATAEDRAATAQALAGTAATLYWQAGYLGQRITAGAESVAYAARTLTLVQAQHRAGAVSSLEMADAEQNLANQRAAQSTLEQQRVEALNALALLFDGRPPAAASTDAPRVLPTGALPQVAPGLPAALLGRRPDLRAAELRLRESFVNIDAVRASFYPALTLNGSIGGSSTALADLLRNPIGTLGAGITLPFLQVTQRQLGIQVSETQYEEAVVNFRQTLYQALADADNALSAQARLAAQGVDLAQALAASQRAERLYEVRYRLGATPLRTWLDAQERRRNAENAVTDNRFNRLANHATLVRVLGGRVE